MNCSIATPGFKLKVTLCISLWMFCAEKNVFKSSPVHIGDKHDTRTRLSSNGPRRTGTDIGGVISFTCIRAPLIISGSFCTTRLAAVWTETNTLIRMKSP